jgi:hypothetical protein
VLKPIIKIKKVKKIFNNKKLKNKNEFFKKNKTTKQTSNQFNYSLDTALKNSGYYKSLLYPELQMKVSIPSSINPIAPVVISRHISLVIPVNAAGCVGVCILPEALIYNGGTFSNIAYTIGATYDGTTNPVNIQYPVVNLSIGSGDFITSRLVSSSAHMYSTQSNLARSGKIVGNTLQTTFGAMTAGNTKGMYIQTPGAKALDMLPSDYFVQSSLVNTSGAVTSQLTNGEHTRLVWRPDQESCFVGNVPAEVDDVIYGTVLNEQVTTAFCFIATGVAVSTTLNLDIFYNYELIPDSSSIIVNTGRFSKEFVLPSQVVAYSSVIPKAQVTSQIEHPMLGRSQISQNGNINLPSLKKLSNTNARGRINFMNQFDDDDDLDDPIMSETISITNQNTRAPTDGPINRKYRVVTK